MQDNPFIDKIEFARYIERTQRSIDFLSCGLPGPLEETLENIISAPALSGIRLRSVINGSFGNPVPKAYEIYVPFYPFITKNRWEIRIVSVVGNSMIILDGEKTFFNPGMELMPNPDRLIIYRPDKEQTSLYLQEFERWWERGRNLIYSDNEPHAVYPDKNIILASENTWSNLIESLHLRPEGLYSLSPRKFEELIAELLHREGMIIHLLPETRDGGRDILAITEDSLGRHLYYVECKRFAKNRPVNVGLVRALFGAVEKDRATAGLLVTTSYFSRDANNFREEIKHRMSFKDYTNLIEWLKKLS